MARLTAAVLVCCLQVTHGWRLSARAHSLLRAETEDLVSARSQGGDASRRFFAFSVASALSLAAPTGALAFMPSGDGAGSDGDAVGAVAAAYFSGGDARLLAPPFDAVRGVFSTTVGTLKDGTRAVRVDYDPTMASYSRLLGAYWRSVDPTQAAAAGQFGDAGVTYRAAVWPLDASESDLALESRQRLDGLGLFNGARVATEVVAPQAEGSLGFEEDDEQKWAKKNRDEYAKLRQSSGRDAYYEATYKALDKIKTVPGNGGSRAWWDQLDM